MGKSLEIIFIMHFSVHKMIFYTTKAKRIIVKSMLPQVSNILIPPLLTLP